MGCDHQGQSVHEESQGRPRPSRLSDLKDKPDTKVIDVWLKTFREKYDRGEQLKVVGREIYIDYGPSIGQSKLLLPKKLCIGTARNWNTVLKLDAMLND